MRKVLDGLVALVAFIVLLAVVVLLASCDRSLRRENERLRHELAMAQRYVPLQRDTIRDTVEVITQKVVEVERIRDVLTQDEKALLRDLGLKVSELESLQKTGVITRDTVYLTEKDSTEDAPLIYRDAWTDIEYRDRRMVYAMRDSIAVAVKREYKHRFLWWRWKVKGYEVKVANFNPHATIRYNTYVQRHR